MISWYEPILYMLFGLITGVVFAGILMFGAIGMTLW